MIETLNDLLQWLDKIQGLSAGALVLLSCVVLGYVLRFIKKFPNDGIPVVVILWGAVAMLMLADPRATSMPARVWTLRNLIIGLVIGLLAWFIHNFALKKLEDFIASKFPDRSSDTTFFNKPNPPDEKEGF